MNDRKTNRHIQSASLNDIVQPSPLRRRLAILTLIAYIGQPIAATAEIIAAQNAAAHQRPTVDATANGLPLVQIATPSAAGVSHNQYSRFNVDPSGVILNNAQGNALTQQAGYVAGNPNLANGSARIILNEVTSTHRSQLNGYTEVAGQRAEVIIANPNGITCNGCGFINTSRGVLTTGTPVMGVGGSLDAYRVTGGDIQIGASGLNGSNLDQLDLISRSLKVNGEIWANNLNAITGANQVNHADLGVQLITGDANKPTVGIDVALLAGRDTLEKSSSSLTVTDPNFFSKQRLTITDTESDLTHQGSTLNGQSVTISSGGNTILQAADIAAGEGGIAIDAGNDLQYLAAADQHSRTHTEKLQTDGYLFRIDGSLNDTDTRRKNNKFEEQTVTNQVTKLVSGGNITSHSKRHTRIEATEFDAQGGIDLSAGVEATYNEDGSIKTEAVKGDITFAGVKDSHYLNDEKKQNSMPWQSSSGHGEMVETIKLANIKTGKGLTVDATGDIIIDIPEVAAEAAALVEAEEALPTKGADGKPLTKEQIAVLVAEREAQAAEKAIQAAAEKKIRDAQRFKDHIQTLAKQPGQEWIGQLAEQNTPHFNEVKLAAEHWDYSHEGLTPEAAAVIVVVVTYFTAGAGSSAVGTTTATTAGSTTAVGGTTLATTTTTAAGVSVTSYTVAGAALNAGVSTLASQAALSFVNNKGDLGKTLDDMGKSENVRNVIAAMLTAGVGTALPSTNMTGVLAQTAAGCATGDMTGIGCQQGATNAAVTSGAALAYHTMVGYPADLRPGDNRNGTKADGTSTGNATYVPDSNPNSPTFGQQQPADVGMNVIGFNRPGSIGSQGGTISNTLNQVPFVNAAGGWHDYIFNADLLTQSAFNNVWTMVPAALISIPASLNDPSVSWLFINGRPYTLDTPSPPTISSPRPRAQPVLSVNSQGARP